MAFLSYENLRGTRICATPSLPLSPRPPLTMSWVHSRCLCYGQILLACVQLEFHCRQIQHDWGDNRLAPSLSSSYSCHISLYLYSMLCRSIGFLSCARDVSICFDLGVIYEQLLRRVLCQCDAMRCDANYLNFRAPRVMAKDHKMNGKQVVFASITG